MDILLSGLGFLQKGLFSTGPFFLLLGVLIFIHELGHFLAARYCGVTVEVFSLGFGPKILQRKKGETVYCISLFPLGGYVKMFGDNPMKEVPDSEKGRGFLYKSVPQKLLIAFGGPFMNLLFTLMALFALGLMGVPSLSPFAGDIEKASPAYEAGFRSGDKIVSINGEPVSYWKELSKAIKNNPGKTLAFEVLSESGKTRRVQAAPAWAGNPDVLDWRSRIGNIKGLSAGSRGTKVGVISGSPAHKAGLRTFDEIKSLGGKKLVYARDLEPALRGQSFPLKLEVQREGRGRLLTVSVQGPAGAAPQSLKALGIESPQLYVFMTGPGLPAEKAGLQKGDRLLSINGRVLEKWEDVVERVSQLSGAAAPDSAYEDRSRASLPQAKPAPLSFKYRRGEREKTALIAPKSTFVEGNLKEKPMIGIGSVSNSAFPPQVLRKRSVPAALAYSGGETWRMLKQITAFLARMAQGKVSFRNMGGAVAIGRISHKTFHAGFYAFLLLMAGISINLFFINLLPIPLLDGGHILFFSLEGLMGRPLDLKKLVLAQQAGLLFVLFFVGWTFFNDINNWLSAW